ncbi:MAG: hypothetical protein N2234_08505, partial [Planctomycetota bacterium]|nr:hypothetical protein [Planctomycetota bacterium]
VRLKDAGASVVGFADKEKVVLLSLSLPLNTVLEVFEVLFDVVVVEGLKESDYSKVVVDDKKEYGNVIAHISIKDKDWRRKISAVVRMVKKSRGDKKVTLVADEDVLSANRFVSGLSLRLARALFESLRGGEDSSVVSLVARLK